MGQSTARPVLFILMTFILLSIPQNTFAQYFGRNKVQYNKFDFKILETENFQIYYYPETEEVTMDAARMVERWYARLSDVLNYQVRRKNPIIFYANSADFHQTNIVSVLIGEGTGGLTEGLKQRVVIPFSGSYSEIDHVIGHELIHVFHYDIDRTASFGYSGLQTTPLWFIEGMSEYLSIGRHSPQTAMYLRDGIINNRFPSLNDLTVNYDFFPYRWGHAFWAYVAGRWGDRAVGRIYKLNLDMGWENAVRLETGRTPKELSEEWREAARETYSSSLEGKTLPNDVGRRLSGRGGVNIAPSLSPDGKRIAFLSQRDVFTIDLFVADTETGKRARRLARSQSDRHFDALRFIDSSGSWCPEGRRFAFVVYAQGRNEINIYDVDRGRRTARITDPDIGSMSNPNWSPDGNRIVFTGSTGGKKDMYIHDLRDRSTIQLTNDKYAELQPVWAPDGESIVFVTDRLGTDFETLKFGKFHLARMDLETGSIRIIRLFSDANHTNPQFSPDGNSIYFVSDQDGFHDIYRYSIEDRAIWRVTSLATGVIGYSPLTPSLSVSRETGLLAFSVFSRENFNIHFLESEEIEERMVSRLTISSPPAGLLPPLQAWRDGEVYAYLNDPVTDLPEDTDWEVTDYSPSLKLDYIGLPSVGITADRYGTTLGGGFGALFSDMLGDHILGIDAQLSGSFRDFGAQMYYINRRNRWNWGGVTSRIPYISSFITARDVMVDTGDDVVPGIEIEQLTDRVYVSQISFTGEYPLSMVRRFQATGGFRHLSYRRESDRLLVVGDQVISIDYRDLGSLPSLSLIETSFGFVGDDSYFGFTSPMRGGRYIIEMEPVFGSLNYFSILADWRRYFFERNFTIALRFLHYGRYGTDAEHERMSPLFIGYSTLVRGYGINTFNLSGIVGDNFESFPQFDRLVGSRMGIANLELRIPLVGIPQYGIFTTKYLPVEIAGFLDAGTAWTRDESPVFRINRSATERIPVFSAGGTSRFNVLGYFVAEIFYAYPFQHPNSRGNWGFQLTPGW